MAAALGCGRRAGNGQERGGGATGLWRIRHSIATFGFSPVHNSRHVSRRHLAIIALAHRQKPWFGESRPAPLREQRGVRAECRIRGLTSSSSRRRPGRKRPGRLLCNNPGTLGPRCKRLVQCRAIRPGRCPGRTACPRTMPRRSHRKCADHRAARPRGRCCPTASRAVRNNPGRIRCEPSRTR
jgi:hypothetical protein